jgi:hypothetical protein
MSKFLEKIVIKKQWRGAKHPATVFKLYPLVPRLRLETGFERLCLLLSQRQRFPGEAWKREDSVGVLCTPTLF